MVLATISPNQQEWGGGGGCQQCMTQEHRPSILVLFMNNYNASVSCNTSSRYKHCGTVSHMHMKELSLKQLTGLRLDVFGNAEETLVKLMTK